MTKKKIGIFGYARHGKDTVAELICNKLNYSFCSSSYFVCSKAVFPVLSKKYGYTTLDECFNDRMQHRVEWKQLITEYTTPDKSKLARELLAENDIYVGMRCKDELNACIQNDVFDTLIWVDNNRLEPENESSCTIRKENYIWDIFIPNYFSLQYLDSQVDLLISEGVFGDNTKD